MGRRGEGPPPGWYADPEGDGTRYWDGERWTDRRSGEYLPPPSAPRAAPPPRERASWGTTNWKWLAAGALGLLLGAAAGAAPDLAATETETSTVVRVETQVETETKTETVRKVKTVREPAAQPSPSPDQPSAGGGVQTYSGNGGKNLGTIELPADSTLEWTNDGALFQIFTADDVPVNSQAHSGTTELSAGSHRDFQVNAVGNWTITIRPH